jgi:alkaline phosphatase D
MTTQRSSVTRRDFVQGVTAGAVLLPWPSLASGAESGAPHQALGTRVGEVTDHSAIIWTRLTKNSQRNNNGTLFDKKANRQRPESVTVPIEQIEGACPGMSGRVRMRYGLNQDLKDAVETKWTAVDETTDHIHQFTLSGLQPGTTYHYASQASQADNDRIQSEFRGKFCTAPERSAPSSFRFCVMTCQGYPDRDHADGHPIYPSMLALEPKFVTMTGDLVYYDSNEPRAVSPALARLHWERMFSLPRIVAMMRNTASYWLKDDHDTVTNDSWPGMNAGELSFAEGQQIFRQQAPLGSDIYRTYRWGRDLQIWFTDGRDFRSPNRLPDGPDKTIWGAEQKAWFKRTVQESDATWKVLISPTPLVGPDRTNKNDNHSNPGFAHEGDELRTWIQAHVPDNFFVVCGDRHWQYHSVHPKTGVQEFSAGPASNSHAGGTPGEDKQIHRFHRVQGGFLSVELRPEGSQSRIAFQLRNVDGEVSYEATFRRSPT